MPFNTTSVEYACLLPAESFALQVRSGVVSAAAFSLSQSGAFSISPSASTLIALDTFHGLTRLKAIAALCAQLGSTQMTRCKARQCGAC